MLEKNREDVRTRQEPLRERYREDPAEAMITDRAQTVGGVNEDPFHGQVKPGSLDYGVLWPFGIHHAIGGYHDLPNPGDILCTALATCLDSSVRIIADRLDVTLTALEVTVTANVDVRGTLMVDHNVPVGFQSMHCHVNLQTVDGTDARLVKKLLNAAEYSCVNLQTLRSGIPVEMSVEWGSNEV